VNRLARRSYRLVAVQARLVVEPSRTRTKAVQIAPMNTRLLPVLALIAVPDAAVAPRPQERPTVAPVPLSVIADSFIALNRPNAGGSTWGDRSDSARIIQFRRLDRMAADLNGPRHPADTGAMNAMLRDNLVEVVNSAIATRACRFHLWSVPNQFSGWHVAASNWARTVRVGDDSARARALRALNELPNVMHEERALLQRGLDSGYTSSAPVMTVVTAQYGDLLPDDVTRSPLFAPALRDSSPQFRMAWRDALEQGVYPAAASQRRWLTSEYIPRARPNGSLAGLPDGVTCYRASLRAQSSGAADPAVVMAEARREVTRLRDELRPLSTKLTGDDDVGRAVQALRADARFTFSSRDSILPEYRRVTALAARLFPKVVAGFEAESLEVLPYPEFQERAGLPPQYLRAPPDRSRAAQFLVNLSRTERMSVPNAVAHEAYPGHHLQRIAGSRAGSIHPVLSTLSVGGFSEGWGIYSEVLADDMGLYDSDLTRAGYYVHILDVAMGAYLDIGYHTRGWTREMLVDSMMVLGGRPRANAEAYADRHAGTPGQLAIYFIGYNEIIRARREAERKLGSRFNLAEFNGEAIRDGSITLASFTGKMARWTERKR
jgi:uncharacterized protein (DUF885 family)